MMSRDSRAVARLRQRGALILSVLAHLSWSFKLCRGFVVRNSACVGPSPSFVPSSRISLGRPNSAVDSSSAIQRRESRLRLFSAVDDESANETPPSLVYLPSRRDVLAVTTSVAGSFMAASLPARASVAPDDRLYASWAATAGFDESSTSEGFINFNEGAYGSMRDDPGRTPLFERAIRERMAGKEGELCVLDLGTGPFALLALMAARAGARVVYAVEANPEAARRARDAVAKAGFSDVVKILPGFSTSVELPEKADLVLAEIVGSIASEEGMIATLRDAHARLVKRPEDPNSWIPNRAQTFGAPASYALHYAFGPPEYDWVKLKEPVRFNCRDQRLQLLSDEPWLFEDIDFASPRLPGAGVVRPPGSLPTFVVSEDRMQDNEDSFYADFRKSGASDREASQLARGVSRSVTGIAFWPRVVLDPEGSIVVESRGARGEHRRSHWQTVLPIMAERPASVKDGDRVVLSRAEVELRGSDVSQEPRYLLEGAIVRAS